MSQDQITQCKAHNRITLTRSNTEGGSVTNEIFNESHSGFLQTPFVRNLFLEFICKYIYLSQTVSKNRP